MYLQLEATSPCVLRLNGSQSFGCTSSRDGNVGIVHLVYNSTDLDWVLNSSPMDSYIAVLNLQMFSFENLQKLNNSDRINGVLLMQARKDVTYFSPEDTCPNRYSGLAFTGRDMCEPEPWNPRTIYSSISMHKWKIPIFFTDDTQTVQQVEDNFHKFNLPLETQLERSLCALKMSAHMYAAIDSVTCIRRSNMVYNVNPVRFCEPLGDDNLWAPVVPISITSQKQKYIVVAARLDSTSLFFGRAPGALSTATSLVTLLSTAHLLFNLTSSSQNVNQNVLFMLFNGEAYDYIGSSRVVYDMNRGTFPFTENPISLDDISLFIELSQLQNDKSVIYHSLKSDDEMSKFVNIFSKEAAKYNIEVSGSPSNSHFPPSSFQSFLAKKQNMSGLVLSSYGDQFTNRFYHSLYDDALNVNYKYSNGSDIENDSLQSFVANFSTALAHTLYQEMTGKDTDVVVDAELVDEMLHCYVDSISCKFAEKVDFVESTPYQNLDYYVGVALYLARHQVAMLTRHAFIHLMGRKISVASKDECISRVNSTHYTHSYWSDAGNQCLESAANKSDAVSPAFIIENYNLAEGQYSSWTESTWNAIDVQMFLQPSSKYEWFVFAVGNAVLFSSFIVLWWIKQNSRELFNSPQLMTTSNL